MSRISHVNDGWNFGLQLVLRIFLNASSLPAQKSQTNQITTSQVKKYPGIAELSGGPEGDPGGQEGNHGRGEGGKETTRKLSREAI